MIVAQDLSKSFGKVVAVDSINFTIPRGSVVGFLGSNGAGKTTTIRMITGFLPPTAGRVEVDGIDVARRPLDARRRIGYLPESTPLYLEMRVAEFLRFRARLFGVPRRRREAAIGDALDQCGLVDVARRPIRHLSKGYRQRVGLAAALVHEPPVLVLDEPTVGLDPAQIREVRGLIRSLAGRQTVLLSTHILPEAELTCDEIIMIAHGRIRAQGSIEDLRRVAARTGRYVIEVDRGDAADAVRPLADIQRVETTSAPGGWHRLVVTARPEAADRRADIARALAAAGATVRELTRETATLEQLFLDVVESEAPVGTVTDAERRRRPELVP